MFLEDKIGDIYKIYQGRKRPLDTSKRKIERRERERKVEGEREGVKGIEREREMERHRESESERKKIERKRRFLLLFLVKSPERRSSKQGKYSNR